MNEDEKEAVITEAIEYFGCYLVDNCESLFAGGEDEIQNHCENALSVAKLFMIEAPKQINNLINKQG